MNKKDQQNSNDQIFNSSSISKVNQNSPSLINWDILRKQLGKDKNNNEKSLWGFVNEQQNNKNK